MQNHLLAGSAVAVLIALAGCSSSDGDSGTEDTLMTGADSTLGGDSGPGDSSQFNPDLNGSEPPTSGPGDDATGIAGLWDASETPAVGERYVEISSDGRFTDYAPDDERGNCYDVDGPYTMQLEIEASGEWSTSNGYAFVATSDSDADPQVLDIQFTVDDDGLFSGVDGDPEAAHIWPLASGVVVDDIQRCEADSE